MPIQADHGQRGNAPPHATGVFTPVAFGIMEGAVTFPARGAPIRFRMERRPSDEAVERARLYALTPGISFGYLDSREPDVWTGSLRVEGYLFDVRVAKERGQFMASFSDTAGRKASDSGVRRG